MDATSTPPGSPPAPPAPPTPPTPPTPPSPRRRLPVVALVLGLLLVAVVVAVGLLVERATDDLELPDRLDGGFRATDAGQGFDIDDDDAERFADGEQERAETAEEMLSDVLEADVAVRTYADAGLEQRIDVTVVDQAAGPVPPVVGLADPERLGVERAPYELVREDDAVCQVSWGQTVPEGEEVPDEPPASVTCQLGADGRTYWMTAQQMSAADTADLLADVAG